MIALASIPKTLKVHLMNVKNILNIKPHWFFIQHNCELYDKRKGQ